ncbi:endonuclease/exonuclease/phosphatase family protein [Marinobacter sp. HL-58]|uniref:endonuclease/exonuclease/phosphatase family protein n=1 Tax=Marinobacter sp. HL-58 TaxID=1479237 RepID=UPI00047FC083|nr:endonuclease/exonuclease/phosphatase family protein [Marinobacter sp. HL-58]KPP98896.1 MAG: Metal-dependent hydrolase [Marinobacter sp. HL-58]
MISRIEHFFRRLRHFLSRSLWLARLLRLPFSEGATERPGLVMVQIDGLSRSQFEKALASGEMPFLERLLQKEHYQTRSFYSGLPASTAAVQAELFYGTKTAVPAYSFLDSHSGKVVRMHEAEPAERIERRYATDDPEPLLAGGSAYSDNYSGGAAEPHFCPTSMGWGPALRGANPFVLLTFLTANLYSFVRIMALLFLELGLAATDLVRGIIRGQDFFRELRFIPSRVGVSIVLRELCVIGGKIDIARGLPVIHINLLGYDEQSHRRGPGSLFAHWTLKGIDDAISRLWHATNRSPWRHYDLWVYSDHGQSGVTPYETRQGYPLSEALRQSCQTLKGRTTDGSDWVVTDLGPVAHLYAPHKLSEDERHRLSHSLVHHHQVPVVLTVDGEGCILAYSTLGIHRIPDDTALLFDERHPFITMLGQDLACLCRHEDAGNLVALGWHQGVDPLSFAIENGAHGGLTPEETHGFALLPIDAPLPVRDYSFLRPLDLRESALKHLRSHAEQPAFGARIPHRTEDRQTDTLKVMTYNVHSCIGLDGKADAARIARVIARSHPDVVALQELDVGRSRSLNLDQAHQIAHHLKMTYQFHPAIHLEEERYGDAILTHLPQRLVKAALLPGLPGRPALEPRGAIWVAVEFNGRELQIINTHLGLSPAERNAQVNALLGDDWLGNDACRQPVILCGDFNAIPSSAAYQRLARQMNDVQLQAPGHRPAATFSSRFPALRIDHIFVSSDLQISGLETYRSQLARVASDHLPLLARVTVPAHQMTED